MVRLSIGYAEGVLFVPRSQPNSITRGLPSLTLTRNEGRTILVLKDAAVRH